MNDIEVNDTVLFKGEEYQVKSIDTPEDSFPVYEIENENLSIYAMEEELIFVCHADKTE